MGKKLYVGNLAYSVTSESLEQMFLECGAVSSAHVIQDRETGRSKGFGFVEMANDEQAQAAIAAMNGSAVDGRNVVVNESRPKPEGEYKKRPFNGGGGGGGFRRGGGGGGYNRGGGGGYNRNDSYDGGGFEGGY